MAIVKNMLNKMINIFVFTSSLFTLAACFSGITPLESRVALDPAGTTTATYNRGPLSVNYSYTTQQDILQISGNVRHQGAVDDLNVRLEFLDQEGQVLKRELVYSSGYRVRAMEDSKSFDAKVKIPSGATAFAFSSSERARTGNK